MTPDLTAIGRLNAPLAERSTTTDEPHIRVIVTGDYNATATLNGAEVVATLTLDTIIVSTTPADWSAIDKPIRLPVDEALVLRDALTEALANAGVTA